MNTTVENYLINGCGRCPLGNTPACKVRPWAKELKRLRKIVRQSPLKEEVKWGVPVYTYNGKNVLSISALKKFCVISFFKGSLLIDRDQILLKPGPNSQASRYFACTTVEEINLKTKIILSYILEAIAVEKSGQKVIFKQKPEPMPEELIQILEADPIFKNAFESLSPGRQRGYILFFSAAKQSNTRMSRIEKCTENILNGRGMHDKYQRKKQ